MIFFIKRPPPATPTTAARTIQISNALNKRNDTFSLHRRFGRYFFLPFRSLFLSIIHAFRPPLYQVIIANVHSFIKKKMKTSY